MTKKKTPADLNDADLDQAQGAGPVAQWNLENAWPTSTAAKSGSEVAMEELTLAHEGIERDVELGETPPLSVSYTLKR